MNFIVKISLRNLLRQKRRNILLGTAIALGTAILIIAHGFSHGISDNLFNRIVVYVSGHIGVAFSENGNLYKQVFHDGPGIKEIIKKEIPDVIKVEEGTWVFCRAVGNGKSDNVVMIGLDLGETGDEKIQQQDADNFKIIDGRFEDLGNKTMENPVFLAKEKAAFLNVEKGDVLRVRYRNINGQDQSARLTVAGIFLPANMFMTAPVFLELNNLKKLMGYAPNDVGQLFITIKNPKKNAIKFAEKLHAALKPDIARIDGYLLNRNDSVPVTVLGFKTDSVSLALIRKNLTADSKVDRNGCFIGDSLASALGIVPGTVCQISYKSKHQESSVSASIKTTAVFPGGVLPGNVILLNDDEFYKVYYSGWPLKEKDSRWHIISPSNPLIPALSEEWTLFPRAKTTDELTRLQKEISSKKVRGTSVDVRTMYESASAVLSLEYALHSITIVAVMVLFFIILIGVINTLRMTVRERTREIGTIRAIGMQKSDVMISFILETFFLTLFSSLAGTVLAFVAMKVLSMFRIDAAGNPVGMMLVNERLYFVPVLSSVILFICLIIAIAVVTAFFPARRAANLSAAEALRHFD
ncbi:MAG TPA: FtsX-like permease family protein [Chitinispirillaceae bacterium]|jgi:ABC-type lipoprotein release transport system permease subunit|nr:FtsX-like permease family protein [Chitinispirillaceae bacterium]